ncbi:hypothetical protein FACS1894190_01630 [Spirochaetia bacterium]|nr:hypothetical protein FACS1894190_01630 [Spirochaetia bacterium]
MANFYYKNGSWNRKRFVLIVVFGFVFFIAGSSSVFAGNSGFFFEAGVDYRFAPFWEPIEGRKTLTSIGGHGALGCTFGHWDISIESGYVPMGYRNVNDDVKKWTQIPGVLRIGYSTAAWHGFTLKPEISGGVTFAIPDDVNSTIKDSSVPGTATTLNIDYTVAAGINLVYTFPGDHVSFFAGGVYNFYLPRENISKFYGSMQVRAGLIIHPFKSRDEYR